MNGKNAIPGTHPLSVGVVGTYARRAANRVVAEVQQHIGQNQVRAVAMSSTDGVTRGMRAVDTGNVVSGNFSFQQAAMQAAASSTWG